MPFDRLAQQQPAVQEAIVGEYVRHPSGLPRPVSCGNRARCNQSASVPIGWGTLGRSDPG
jgi:hypothetical protein